MSRSADRLRASGEGPRAARPTTRGVDDAEVSAARRVHAVGAGRRPLMTVQRLEHSGIVVDDIHASLAGLGAHGGEMVGDLENYENSHWLCYVRGPAGIHRRTGAEDRLMGVESSVRSTSTDPAKPAARKATTGRAPRCCCSPPPRANRVPNDHAADLRPARRRRPRGGLQRRRRSTRRFLDFKTTPIVAVQVKPTTTPLGRGLPRSRRSPTCRAS